MAEFEPNALLVLEDGTVFHGRSFGARTHRVGEAVFNTSMTGYQEIVTDPSYRGQLVTLTAPQIGNYGVNPDDGESAGPQVSGLIVRDLSPVESNYRSTGSLDAYLRDSGIPGISGIDTRTLVRKLRISGVMRACLATDGMDAATALAAAQSWAGLGAIDFVGEVTPVERFELPGKDPETGPFTVVGTDLSKGNPPPVRDRSFHVVALDFGAKRSIFQQLRERGFRVTVFPAETNAETILAEKPDGVFLSNGPGDPARLDYAHQTVRTLIERNMPIFGICLGHQIITHAIGASTFKLKFGHRGGNQPVKNLETGRVSITSQNHGYASEASELERCGAVVTEVNLNDQTVAGLRLRDKPVFSVQYHPEAGPGPNDGRHLFDAFYDLLVSSSAA